MPLDLRAEAARYFDLNPNVFDDVPSYVDRLTRADARVLELGCGTGRVSLPLMEHCAFLHGLDLSDAMLAICQEKIQSPGGVRIGSSSNTATSPAMTSVPPSI